MTSRRRSRHQKRQPAELAIDAVVSELVAGAGTVAVQRMSYDWRADDVLIQIRLSQALSGLTLQVFRRELGRRIRGAIAVDDPLQDWLVVIEHEGAVLARVAPRDALDEIASDE